MFVLCEQQNAIGSVSISYPEPVSRNPEAWVAALADVSGRPLLGSCRTNKNCSDYRTTLFQFPQKRMTIFYIFQHDDSGLSVMRAGREDSGTGLSNTCFQVRPKSVSHRV